MKRVEVRNANMGVPRDIPVDFAAAGRIRGASRTKWEKKSEVIAESPHGKEIVVAKKE